MDSHNKILQYLIMLSQKQYINFDFKLNICADISYLICV